MSKYNLIECLQNCFKHCFPDHLICFLCEFCCSSFQMKLIQSISVRFTFIELFQISNSEIIAYCANNTCVIYNFDTTEYLVDFSQSKKSKTKSIRKWPNGDFLTMKKSNLIFHRYRSRETVRLSTTTRRVVFCILTNGKLIIARNKILQLWE